MPPDKLQKTLNRIADAVSLPSASRHQLEQLLGSLRYMNLCCRSTRAFIQRLHQLWRRSSRFQKVCLPVGIRHDLRWIESLLQNGAANSVPTSIMAETLAPDVHLFMDASNEGLSVIYPAAREYIRVKFDEEERLAMKMSTSGSTSLFSINVREALSAVLAVLVWGPQWQGIQRPGNQPVHVRCWIDNTSAVAWIGNHNTSNTAGQELTRVMSCAELMFNLHVTTKHLQGSSNVLADQGSRAWTGTALKIWTNRMRLWCKQDIPIEFRKIYKAKLPSCNGSRSQTRLASDTSTPGVTGSDSVPDRGFDQWMSPDDPDQQSVQLIMFAVECWQGQGEATHHRVDTIRARLSHVRWCHQFCAGFRPALQPQHELVLHGMRRLSSPRRQRAAVTIGMLRQISSAVDMSIAQHRVLCGAAVLGFFFCLRGAEYLCSRGKRHAYSLPVGDVIVYDSTGMTSICFTRATSVQITLRGSKTDQSGQSATRTLLKSGLTPVCPVFAALLLLRNATLLKLSPDSPLCSTGTGRMLSAETMTKVLRVAARQVGEDPVRISTHSLRTGGASAMHAAGIDTDTIRMHGRWASDAYRAYIREAPAITLQLAKRMGYASTKPNRLDLPRGAARAQALERPSR